MDAKLIWQTLGDARHGNYGEECPCNQANANVEEQTLGDAQAKSVSHSAVFFSHNKSTNSIFSRSSHANRANVWQPNMGCLG
jgi:hypothetical protein